MFPKQAAMPIALQLWTVREQAERDMLGTLRSIAQIGYRAVEFAGLGGVAAAEVRRVADEQGLMVASAHVPLAELTERRARVIDQMAALGCRRVVLPWIPPEQRASLGQVRALADWCNNTAAALAAEKIEFAYHNEDYDFLPLGESTLWHSLVEYTDPRLVQIQLDLFTAQLMNIDPIALMRQYGARITSLHICDERERAYVPIGTGNLDWQSILATARTTAAEWLIVEQDGSSAAFADAATSLAHLSALLAVEPAQDFGADA